MKKSKKLFPLSALLLCGGITLGVGLTSCGPSEPTPDPTPTPTPLSTSQLIVENKGETKLSLPSHLLLESRDATYFSPYVVTVGLENSISPLSSGGDTLMVGGQKAALYAYNVPEGSKLSVSVTDVTGAPSDVVTVASDGTITAKSSVTGKVDGVITLYAEDPTETVATTAGTQPRVYKKSVNVSVIPSSQLASSTVSSYGSTLDVRNRSEVTSQLEKYALKNGLTGISISDNGGYAVYNSRVHSPLLDSDSYLAGYGFGTSMYGYITDDLSGEQTPKYKRYYHSQLTPSNEPGTINYLDSDLASVSDLYSYMAASYWSTELNEDYTETVYAPNLARSLPVPLNMGADGTATKWRIPVWVGGTTTNEEKGVMAGLSYRTSSSSVFKSKWDKKAITLEDYLTPFKLLATQAVGWYRGEEQAGESTANRQIKGFANFYNASKDLKELPSDEEFSSQVGVSLDYDTNSIIIEFEGGFTQEFACYQLDGLWSNPIPEQFIKELGNGDVIKGSGLYGTSGGQGGTPINTSLSVGPYYLEEYKSKELVTFAKNEDWFRKTDSLKRTTYQIEGYHFKVNSALETDSTAGFTAWENNLVDSATLIDSKWEQYENDPRKKSVLGDQQQKFTFNRMDKWLWDQNFGEGAPWYEKNNPKGEVTWEVKPIASNDSFFYGLNLGVDRLGFAEKFHRNPSIDYQNPIAKVNPVTGELYNNSPEHKEAMEYVYGKSFDDLKKTLDYAVNYMRTGIIEELEAGHYDLGTGENPTVVTLGLGTVDDVYYRDRVAVIEQDWVKSFETAVTTYIDENGNNPLVDANGKPRIVFDLTADYVPSDTSQQELIMKGMWCGKYDIQYAYLITGNAYDTINNMDILMSDKMGGFELNFASDTRLPSGDIYYDGKYWSYNSLWSACNGGTVLDSNGLEVTDILGVNEDATGTLNSDGTATIKFKLDELVSGFKTTVITDVKDGTYGPYYLNNTQSAYGMATSCTVSGTGKDAVYTLTLPADAVFPGTLAGGPEGSHFVQFYISYTVQSASGEGGSAVLETIGGVLF